MAVEGTGSAKLIGGVFGLTAPIERPTRVAPRFLSSDNAFFVNATSALALLFRKLQPKQIWLPSYSCVALLNAAQHARRPARFYPISYDLEVQSRSWFDEIRPGDVVVFVSYFGFPVCDALVGMAKQRGAIVIEDGSQALFGNDSIAKKDFTVFSPRKFIGVPDGGILLLNHPLDTSEFPLDEPPAAWWITSFNASVLRREFDICGVNRDWFKLFQHAESNAPIGNFCISELSRTLLTYCVDYDTIRQRRRDNFDMLATALADIAVFPVRPPSVTPLAFPIRVKNRDRVREKLFNREIYPPVHWDLKFVPLTFTDSHRLSNDIMSLPCDQRYDQNDMERVIVAVTDAIGDQM